MADADDSSTAESDIEEPEQGSAKRQRSRAQAALSKPKQQPGSRGKGQKGGSKKGQSSAEPARRSSRHGERNISYAEDDIEVGRIVAYVLPSLKFNSSVETIMQAV